MPTKTTTTKKSARPRKAAGSKKPARSRKGGNQHKVLAALGDSFDAMVDAVKIGNDRGLRFSRRLINEIGQGQHEVTRLGRRFANRPTNMSALYHDTVDLARRGSGHASQLSQEFISSARGAGQDLRGATGTLIKANRKAAEALGHAVQDAASDLVKRGRRKPAKKAAPRKRRAPAAKARTTAKRRTTRTAARKPRAAAAKAR